MFVCLLLQWLIVRDKKAMTDNNEVCYEDYTCLHYAAEENYLHLVKALLASGKSSLFLVISIGKRHIVLFAVFIF